MHIKTPRFQLAHRGSTQNQRHNSPRSAPIAVYARLFLLQSEQLLLASSLTRLFNVARFCSARSAAGLGRLNMVSFGKAGWNVSCAGGRFAVQAGWLAYRTGRNVSGGVVRSWVRGSGGKLRSGGEGGDVKLEEAALRCFRAVCLGPAQRYLTSITCDCRHAMYSDWLDSVFTTLRGMLNR
jgi:hypothetical protein